MAAFDKFTERGRKIFELAQAEALRFNHPYIGTEHILLGLVREGDGVAARVLANMGIKLPKVRSAVEFIIGRDEFPPTTEPGLTPRSKRVIELAIDEARGLSHHYIGTEHILLGLVREGEGIAAGVLGSLGVDLGKVRAQILEVVGGRAYAVPFTAVDVQLLQQIIQEIPLPFRLMVGDGDLALTDALQIFAHPGDFELLRKVASMQWALDHAASCLNTLNKAHEMEVGVCEYFAEILAMAKGKRNLTDHVAERCPRCNAYFNVFQQILGITPSVETQEELGGELDQITSTESSVEKQVILGPSVPIPEETPNEQGGEPPGRPASRRRRERPPRDQSKGAKENT